jgi:hypothetical protein
VVRRFLLTFIVACVLAPLAVGARTYTLQQGVALSATPQQSVDSKSSTAGTPLTLLLTAPYPNSLLKGATVYGHVADVQKAGQGTEPRIVLAFDRIKFYDGQSRTLHAQLLKDSPVQDKSGKETNAIARAAGGLLGPAHGIGVALLSKNHKDNITIPRNSTVVIELTQPLQL